MKMNKKGFTLIELLAVIVILAVIALISTPLIIGIIEDAREGSAQDSSYGYVKAFEMTIAKETIKDTSYTPNQNQTDPVNVHAKVFDTSVTPATETTRTSKVNYKGSNPTKIGFIIENGAVKSGSTIEISGFNFTLNTKGEWKPSK